jgi:hypothetical protein
MQTDQTSRNTLAGESKSDPFLKLKVIVNIITDKANI